MPAKGKGAEDVARARETGAMPAGLESYLEAIYVLTVETERVTSRAVAEYLAVAPVSVSRALTRLEDRSLLESRTPEVRLTESGWRLASGVVRRHRLAERWLADRLGLDLVTAHKEAEKIEHALSPAVERALFEDLGHPDTCPHGNPIPDEEGTVPIVSRAVRLSEAPPGTYVVDRLFEELEGLEWLLQSAGETGLVPGACVELVTLPAAQGGMSRSRERDTGVPRVVHVGEHAKRVPAAVARRILIRPVGTADGAPRAEASVGFATGSGRRG